MNQYDSDPIVQDFLQRTMLHHRLSHSSLLNDIIDIIHDYLVWNDTKLWFQKPQHGFLHNLSLGLTKKNNNLLIELI